MIAARVIGRAKDTGKLYQAMRGEQDSRVWSWIEIAPPFLMEKPDTGGDVIFDFPTKGDFPMMPPAFATAQDEPRIIQG